MLAYVFWHAPAEPRGTAGETRAVAPDDPAHAAGYEVALLAFHHALAAGAFDWLVWSASYRVSALPWLGDGGAGYEDVYVVRDWDALGRLSGAAVDSARRTAHDVAAGLAGDGAGGVYALPDAAGAEPEPDGELVWLDKPRGINYVTFRADLEALGGPDGAVWQRQMVLGPAPEFRVRAPAEISGLRTVAAPLRCRRTLVR